MLICMKCHIEYEEGMDFCPQCGGSLAPKEAPRSQEEKEAKPEAVKPDGRLICPKCLILYEKMKTCIRCGTPLMKQSDLREMQKAKPPEAPEIKKGEPVKEPVQMQPPRKQPAEAAWEKPKPTFADVAEQETPPTQAPEKRPSKRLPEDIGEGPSLPEKGKKKFFRSSLGVSSIILLMVAAIYFVWSQYSYFTTKPSKTDVSVSREIGPSPAPSKPSPTSEGSQKKEGAPISKDATSSIPSSSIPVVLKDQEISKIKDTLENIRQANLKKDIGLFMSCYSPDFKGRKERRNATLESWASSNFIELYYILKLNSISIDSAEARVEWVMETIPVTGGQSQESKTELDVVFRKEGNLWKIIEVNPAK